MNEEEHRTVKPPTFQGNMHISFLKVILDCVSILPLFYVLVFFGLEAYRS